MDFKLSNYTNNKVRKDDKDDNINLMKKSKSEKKYQNDKLKKIRCKIYTKKHDQEDKPTLFCNIQSNLHTKSSSCLIDNKSNRKTILKMEIVMKNMLDKNEIKDNKENNSERISSNKNPRYKKIKKYNFNNNPSHIFFKFDDKNIISKKFTNYNEIMSKCIMKDYMTNKKSLNKNGKIFMPKLNNSNLFEFSNNYKNNNETNDCRRENLTPSNLYKDKLSDFIQYDKYDEMNKFNIESVDFNYKNQLNNKTVVKNIQNNSSQQTEYSDYIVHKEIKRKILNSKQNFKKLNTNKKKISVVKLGEEGFESFNDSIPSIHNNFHFKRNVSESALLKSFINTTQFNMKIDLSSAFKSRINCKIHNENNKNVSEIYNNINNVFIKKSLAKSIVNRNVEKQPNFLKNKTCNSMVGDCTDESNKIAFTKELFPKSTRVDSIKKNLIEENINNDIQNTPPVRKIFHFNYFPNNDSEKKTILQKLSCRL